MPADLGALMYMRHAKAMPGMSIGMSIAALLAQPLQCTAGHQCNLLYTWLARLVVCFQKAYTGNSVCQAPLPWLLPLLQRV